MLQKLLKKDKRKYLTKWIKDISKDETDLSLKRHIVKHAKEIFENDPKKWAASMRNLIEIFEAKYKIKPSIDLQLERLEEKYKKNPKRYTDPPKIRK
ncbi:hypothetical protein HOD96_00185 [Candidatus Falkowbacteria bacterium]|jgi:hypothetical protein|nr:hypothetical protein [Candidatus Falkowbacteria bacterium]MBT4432829.1 hypothetical protein [Candidatus Falkowbacteria bacterium]